jgi:hypothetical protein
MRDLHLFHQFLLLLIPNCDEDDDYTGKGGSKLRSKAHGSLSAEGDELVTSLKRQLLTDVLLFVCAHVRLYECVCTTHDY